MENLDLNDTIVSQMTVQKLNWKSNHKYFKATSKVALNKLNIY